MNDKKFPPLKEKHEGLFWCRERRSYFTWKKYIQYYKAGGGERIMQCSCIGKSYNFSAAHHLTGVPADHPCRRVHGHNYKVEISVQGAVDLNTGMILDFWDMDRIIKPLIKKHLDHRDLNDVLENPTAENLAHWFLENLSSELHIASITVWETEKCWAKCQ